MEDIFIWRRARTYAQYGACVALWLEGRLSHRPTSHYCEGVGNETKHLIPTLAALNRTGKFLTEQSQPGCTPTQRILGGEQPYQRAAVMGFVPEAHVHSVVRSLRAVPCLEVKVSRPAATSTPPSQVTCITRRRTEVRLFGAVLGRQDIQQQLGPIEGWSDYPGLHPQMITQLTLAWQVSVMDTRWGYNATLWPALRRLGR